jgi:hypothetical protein
MVIFMRAVNDPLTYNVAENKEVQDHNFELH